MLTYLLQGAALGFSGAVSPGPFQAYLISQSLRLGWRRALPAVLAPLISDGPIIALVLLLLNNLPPAFLRVLQIAGGFFVLYLGWKSFQAYRRFQPVDLNAPGVERQNLFQAALMNFLSPGPYIFWSILAGPILVQGWQQSPGFGLVFLAGFYFLMVGTLAVLVLVFGAARQIGPRVNRLMIGISALALLGFGIYQLWQGVLGYGIMRGKRPANKLKHTCSEIPINRSAVRVI
jgi:threonine/homoserine/homoserine lactone efflux protein